MRAACRNCRLHRTKRSINPLQIPRLRTPVSSRIPVTPCHEDGCTIRPTNPLSVSLSKLFIAGSLAPPDRCSLYLLVYRCKGGVERAGRWSVHRCCVPQKSSQGSGLSPIITASHSNLLRLRCKSIGRRRSPAALYACGAASRDRAVSHERGRAKTDQAFEPGPTEGRPTNVWQIIYRWDAIPTPVRRASRPRTPDEGNRIAPNPWRLMVRSLPRRKMWSLRQNRADR